jgi:DNA-binding MltR family transcriptional regulator
MKINYRDVREPHWSSSEHSSINCQVFFEHLGHEVPFTASPVDSEPHGREIFKRCVSGKFGAVAPAKFDAPALAPEELQPPVLPVGWHDIHEFLEEANRENASGTERGLVLVWASMVDEMLCRLLEQFLVDSTITKDMLRGGSGPLSAFSARTKAAFSLGLISKDELQAIEVVRSVRNSFAHKLGISLADTSLHDKCKGLYQKTYNDNYTFDAKHYYSAACTRLLMILSGRIASITQNCRIERTDPRPIYDR